MREIRFSEERIAVAAAIGLACCLMVTGAVASDPERFEEKAVEASQFLVRMLEQQPGNPRALYNHTG